MQPRASLAAAIAASVLLVVCCPPPAAAQASFLRGDANADTSVDVSDPVFILIALFRASGGIPCEDAADANDDGGVNLSDAVFLLDYLFRNGIEPPLPGAHSPGFDATSDDPFTCGDPPAGGNGESSFDRIQEALRAGTIDEEAALLYTMFALFEDERLPEGLRGASGGDEDAPLFFDVIDRYESLSSATRDAIAPFFLPPSAPESWLELREGAAAGGDGAGAGGAGTRVLWNTIPVLGGKVKVWWQQRRPADEAIAIVVADAMETKIWPDLAKTIMDQEPLSDSRVLPNGGDGAFDVYLCRLGVAARCVPYFARDRNTPTFILLNSPADDPRYRSKMTHEFMHAIQYAYELGPHRLTGEYRWLADATATWAEDAVYSSDDREQKFAHLYLWDMQSPLESNPADGHDFGYRAYGAYVFPFFITKSTGDPTAVRRMWAGAASAPDSLAAVDAAIPGGFEEQWPKFAVSAWGRPPFDDFYRWDELEIIPPPGDPLVVGLEGQGQRVIPFVDVDVEHLAIRYDSVRFEDPDLRRVTFYNGYTFELSEEDVIPPLGMMSFVARPLAPDALEGAAVHALVKIAGEPLRHEDWTKVPIREFCLDRADERIEELVVIFTNSLFADRNATIPPPGIEPRLLLSDAGCWRWSGDMRMTAVEDGVTSFFHAKDLRFDRAPQPRFPPDGGGAGIPEDGFFALADLYPLAAGSIDLTVSGTDSGGCDHSANVSGLAPGLNLEGFNYIAVFHAVVNGDFRRGVDPFGFLGAGMAPLLYSETVHCDDDTFVETRWVPFFSDTPPDGGPVTYLPESDGGRIDSKLIIPDSVVGHLTIEYDLRADREP